MCFFFLGGFEGFGTSERCGVYVFKGFLGGFGGQKGRSGVFFSLPGPPMLLGWLAKNLQKHGTFGGLGIYIIVFLFFYFYFSRVLGLLAGFWCDVL